MGNKTYSILDIFRVENGKITEHWDVMQEVPAKSANTHPMF
jgi:predicted SnoaL-like aldol condensation-catalyzing enzyme